MEFSTAFTSLKCELYISRVSLNTSILRLRYSCIDSHFVIFNTPFARGCINYTTNNIKMQLVIICTVFVVLPQNQTFGRHHISIQHLRHPFKVFLKQMHISIIGDFNRRVPQQFTHNFDVNAFGEEHTCEGVAECVDAVGCHFGAF